MIPLKLEGLPQMKFLNTGISERSMFSEIPKCIEFPISSFCFVCTSFQIPSAKCRIALHHSCEFHMSYTTHYGKVPSD